MTQIDCSTRKDIAMERYWEINGNLNDEGSGLKNYPLFEQAVRIVKNMFDQAFGAELLNKIKFYVDNATADSGYTPIATVVLKQIVIIKLGIASNDPFDKIIFQFAHELMHIVFRAIWGIDKPHANDNEEGICTAAALIAVKTICPEKFDAYYSHIKGLTNPGYHSGAYIAENAQYDLHHLLPLVQSIQYF